MASLWTGIVEATYETNYLVTTSGTADLVVRIYGDTVILADYDAAAHRVRHRYPVQKLGKHQPLNFEGRNPGHRSSWSSVEARSLLGEMVGASGGAAPSGIVRGRSGPTGVRLPGGAGLSATAP